MKVVTNKLIPNTGATPYRRVEFTHDGDAYLACVFPTPGNIIVVSGEGSIKLDISGGRLEAELRRAIGETNPKDVKQTTFEKVADLFGVPDIKGWFGRTIEVPIRVRGTREFTARYTVEGLTRNSKGAVLIECRTRRGNLRQMRLDRARHLLPSAGGQTPAPQQSASPHRALDLEV